MCGITGIVGRPGVAIEEARIREMCDVMLHRGPDDEGLLIDENVGLGMRRLSIIDLESGQQPIHNGDKSVWVILNGEIYNYLDLRRDLQAKGYRFYTQSDTEVIVHLYDEYGDDFVNHLSGMFGFALLDKRRDRVLVARDRIGEKPIFYSLAKDGLVFGSEIKCLLASGMVSADLDRLAVDEYLRYLYVPPPRTIYEDIVELPPASMLVTEKGELVDVRQYWTLTPPEPRFSDEADAVEAVREQLKRSVASRMVSDVPIGALLSGGIDSSAVAYNMVQSTDQPVRTFTIGYEGANAVYDERADARLIADHIGTEHREIEIRPDVVDLIPRLARAFDQPFADSSAIANYYVFRETSKHVKVVLSGLGGDEIFGGYERYWSIRRHQQFGWIPEWLRSKALPTVARLLPEPRSGARHVDRIKRFTAALRLPTAQAYQSYVTAYSPEVRRGVLAPDIVDELDRRATADRFVESFQHFDSGDAVTASMCVDVLNYLPGDLLTLTDRMSMQHSVEARAPLIDYEIIDLAMRIPGSLHIVGREKKRVLREAVRGTIPDEIFDRPKRGFTVPLTNWFRDELQGVLREFLARDRRACVETPQPSRTLMGAGHVHELARRVRRYLTHGREGQRCISRCGDLRRVPGPDPARVAGVLPHFDPRADDQGIRHAGTR